MGIEELNYLNEFEVFLLQGAGRHTTFSSIETGVWTDQRSPVFAKEPKIRAISQSEVLMMSSPLSLFCIEQDSFTKKRMLSGRHELGGSYSRSNASQVLAPLPPPYLLVIRACLMAPPLLGARRC